MAVKSKYLEWIASGAEDLKSHYRAVPVGATVKRSAIAREAAEDMAREYPELRVVAGTYEHESDGRHEYYWLIDPNDPDGTVIDPCGSHWKSAGTGKYVPSQSQTN